jgi:hypothetical protein
MQNLLRTKFARVRFVQHAHAVQQPRSCSSHALPAAVILLVESRTKGTRGAAQQARPISHEVSTIPHDFDGHAALGVELFELLKKGLRRPARHMSLVPTSCEPLTSTHLEQPIELSAALLQLGLALSTHDGEERHAEAWPDANAEASLAVLHSCSKVLLALTTLSALLLDALQRLTHSITQLRHSFARRPVRCDVLHDHAPKALEQLRLQEQTGVQCPAPRRTWVGREGEAKSDSSVVARPSHIHTAAHEARRYEWIACADVPDVGEAWHRRRGEQRR